MTGAAAAITAESCQLESPTEVPWWATRRGRLLHRLGLTRLTEAEGLAQRLYRWESEVSLALDMTTWDHGTWHATLDEAVSEIKRLRAERDAGWSAAYRRGREDEREGRHDATE